MDFSSVPFILIFLPLFISTYLLVRLSFRLGVLLGASVIFLVAGQPIALPWLAGLALISYIFGRWGEPDLDKGKKKIKLLWLGVGINVVILLAFKLLVTYKSNWAFFGSFRLDEIVPPLGLSYITFQTIAYLVDVSYGRIQPENDFIKFLSYILFFPKLISGPITKYQQFIGQIDTLNPSTRDVVSGLGRILVGELKRLIIANQLGLFVNSAFNRPHANIEPIHAWLALIAFALQIYFDFSGYTDMALGLGKVIGVTLPENFNYPYISQSISEFWRRWHMTLIAWFREYVFFPLERRRLKVAGQQINILIVFLLTGLWHGPTLNFLVWGLIQGIAIAFEGTVGGKWLKALWRPIRHLYTLSIILLGLLFFRSASLSFAFDFIGRLAGNKAGASPITAKPAFIIVMFIALLFSMPVIPFLREKFRRQSKSTSAARLSVLESTQSPARNALERVFFYLWQYKQWWLIPMVIVLVSFGFMLMLIESSIPAPFIYALF
jgi:alginate O-acetyltransferase complex protein AlgI